MESSERQPVCVAVGAGARGAILLVPVFLFVWLAVDTRLHYFWPSCFFPAYRFGAAFAADFFGRVGGPVRYAAAFLSQLYYYPAAGAAVLTAVAAGLCGVAHLYLGVVAGRRPSLIHWGPLPLVLALVGRYGHHLDALIAILAAALVAWGYVRFCRRGVWLTPILFVVLSALVHYTSGAAVLLFAFLCVLGELAAGRWWAAAFCAAWGGALPWATAQWLLPARPRLAYRALLWLGDGQEATGRWLLAGLYAYWPVAGVVALVRAAVARRRGQGEGAEAAPGIWGRLPRVGWSLCTAALLAAVALTAWFATDRGERAVRRIEFYSRTGRWDDLLAAVPGLTPEQYTWTVSWDVNRALCHKGLLGERMFEWPQHPTGLLPHPRLFTSDQERFDASPRLSDAFMDLGQVNAAELFGYQAIEIYGAHPQTMQRLVLTALARGETGAGRVLLHSLARDPVYGSWARDMLADLAADPSLAGRPEIQRLRRQRIRRDFVGWFDLQTMLHRQLEADPQNRVAFEYLMAHLMLTGQLEWLVTEMGRLDELDYTRIPRHWEEAVLIYEAATKTQVELGGRAISLETRSRFDTFRRVRQLYGPDRLADSPELRGTYFFYYYAFLMGAAGVPADARSGEGRGGR